MDVKAYVSHHDPPSIILHGQFNPVFPGRLGCVQPLIHFLHKVLDALAIAIFSDPAADGYLLEQISIGIFK